MRACLQCLSPTEDSEFYFWSTTAKPMKICKSCHKKRTTADQKRRRTTGIRKKVWKYRYV